MALRRTPIVTNEVYHIFNKGIDNRKIFVSNREYERGILAFDFYRYYPIQTKLSQLLKLLQSKRDEAMRNSKTLSKQIVEIYSYCLMPNHFHILLKQLEDNGIARFLGNFQNSYTRYYNTKHERVGHLFIDRYKAVHIETTEQLLHVDRYIHLNPLTSDIVANLDDLYSYKWSSLSEYFNQRSANICNKEFIMSHFNSLDSYRAFIDDQADYQRELHKVKRLILE